ncbi:MAG: hypothetical protein H6625_05420 [Bdellovibrionaceae bacterium]|nr:hypothetical protein [Pseudobdellovibrionaceae bacterium]
MAVQKKASECEIAISQKDFPLNFNKLQIDLKTIDLHPTIQKAREDLQDIRKDFEMLISIPSVIQRLHKPFSDIRFDDSNRPVLVSEPGFKVFAMNYISTKPSRDPTEVWNAYRKALGNRSLVRALVLTDAQVQYIKKHGMTANAFRLGISLETIQNRFLEFGLERVFAEHLTFNNVRKSPFMSASGDEEFAQWAAQTTHKGDNSKKIYLFRFQASVADIIHAGAPNESLVYGSIPASSIERVTEATGFIYYHGRD